MGFELYRFTLDNKKDVEKCLINKHELLKKILL
jgi:hypothetical protein